MSAGPPAARPAGTLRRDAALTAVLAAVGVLAVWWVFVVTSLGQRVESTALEGSRIGRGRLAEGSQTVLDVVSVLFLVVVIAAGVALALAQRQWRAALAVPLLVGGANVTTQVLKYGVLTRPDLGVSEAVANSLPSGHTTVAGTVAAVAVLVAPPRWRWAATLAGWAYAGGTGLATMVNGWHRASDVAAAMLVVLLWGALAVLVAQPHLPGPAHGPTTVTRRLLLLAAGFAGLLAALSLVLTAATIGPGANRGELLVAYGGAVLGVAAVTCLTAGLLLHLHTARPAS
ncbi:PAP2 superfamily protein [Georgenia satyanarayanai]|uniref:PAP2 superfamily protein n=1 Tax=Georgenia satyanarayanai TaxID=860221 RepID=A0A2Y9ABE6_9MICO|nr:phosphatase PAP2 family protein [Georgenia satyanarayanai]PYG00256.1 PAP2 superfamily protein [Georgenia satyanarayanai]SSA40578.1 PAP2 superfamily protein [Georgenia satyanarayanai]